MKQALVEMVIVKESDKPGILPTSTRSSLAAG